MTILEPCIPKEYLALKINYCKQQLKALPEITVTERRIRGKPVKVCACNSRFYRMNTTNGQKLIIYAKQREKALCDLAKWEGLWNSSYRGFPPSDIEPRKVIRTFLNNNNEPIILDGAFFESLKNDANPYYPDNKKYYYNGIYYRSIAEVDIARYYTEQGIPFKYEPEIWIKGLAHPIYPDFVIYIKELDLCKFHEHFGMNNFSNYAQKTQVKYINYSEAGLIMDYDVICTYSFVNIPFDTRMLSTKINHVVYSSLFAHDVAA